MDFLILRPLPPKTGYHFFGGGWGGVKSFRLKGSKQWGSLSLARNRWSNGNAADVKFSVGGSNPGRLTFGGGGGRKFVRTADQRDPGRLHYHSATACSEKKGLPTAWGRICH